MSPDRLPVCEADRGARMMYWIEARYVHADQTDYWFPVTVEPVDWKLALGMVNLWRRANPDTKLRARHA